MEERRIEFNEFVSKLANDEERKDMLNEEGDID